MRQATVARVVIILSSVTLFVTTYLGYRKIDNLIELSNLVNETNSSRVQLEKTYALLRSADNELNNFLLTGDTLFYKSFIGNEAALRENISILYAQLRDQPEQCFRLFGMEKLIEERYLLLEKRSRIKSRDERKRAIVETKGLTAEIDNMIKLIVDDQLAMLQKREAIKSRQESVIPVVFLGIASFCVSLLLLAYLKTTRELSLRIAAQQELELKNTALQHSNRELEHFAFGSSHDLQEPLRKIETFCSMIEHKNMVGQNPEAMQLFGKIQTSAGHMRNLINDLMGYAHFYHSENQREPVDLNEVVQEVIQDFHQLIEEKEAKVSYGSMPLVHGVPGQFRRLFQNLIGNALKYSRAVPVIRITSTVVSEEELTGTLKVSTAKGPFHRISVEDNGIGFEEEFSDRIFLMFQRLHDKQQYEGSGIGLAICKKIVQNHGGFISARGVKGRGSVFFVYLPVGAFGNRVGDQVPSSEKRMTHAEDSL